MIQFVQAEKVYANGVKALQNINLTIARGEFVAVIGLSGAGKSTLIRCINRMHHISSGQVLVDGIDVHALKGVDIRRLRRRIGMIFQSFNLVTRTSVIQNVLVSSVPVLPWWRRITGIFSRQHKLDALSALDQVGILDKAYTRVDQLSGGQQQRVALARTLAQQPDIILADEPIASLDPVTAKLVMNDLQKINREMNITIIMNIHHVDFALAYADRIIGIRKGEVVFDGQSQDVTPEVLAEIYGSAEASDVVPEVQHEVG